MKRNACIVVTGANGLAGSAVVERLHSQGYTCVVGLTRDDVDLRNHSDTHKVFTRIWPDYVFHAAALVYGLVGNMRNQGRSILDNTLINTNVIDACHSAGVEKIVAMGTNCIYPDPAKLPYREDTIFDGRPHPGESAYGHSKRHMLAMLEAYKESYGTNYTYLVSGNLYGPRDKFDPVNGHVIPSLIAKFYEASRSESEIVQLWGNGAPQRDFLFSADLARIVELTMFGSTQGPINIGSGFTYSIRDVAGILCSITGISPDRVWFDADKPNGRMLCTSDLSRLAALGFEDHTTVPLRKGLQQTWDWYCEKQYSARPSVSTH